MAHPLTQGSKLADRMQALGYQQQDVADGTGIDRWQLNDYTNKRKKIGPRQLARLATFLQCEPEVIYE